jgi:hypothetical protein
VADDEPALFVEGVLGLEVDKFGNAGGGFVESFHHEPGSGRQPLSVIKKVAKLLDRKTLV